MSKAGGKAFDFGVLKRVLRYVRPYRSLFVGSIFLTVLLAIIGIVRTELLGYLIDFTTGNHTVRPFPGLVDLFEGLTQGKTPVVALNVVTLVIVFILIAEGFFQYFQMLMANRVAQSVTIDLRTSLFSHLLRFRLKFFDTTPIGTLVTRVISDIETIADIFYEGLISVAGDLVKLFVVIFIMFWVNWELALYTLIPVPLLIITTRIFQRSIKKSFMGVRNQVARLNAFVQEHVTGMSIVQIFNREEVEMDKFKSINKEHRKAHIDSVMAYSIFFPVVEILAALSIAFLVWIGTGLALEGRLTFGDIVKYILYVNMLYRPIRMLADRFNTLQMGVVGSERVFSLLDSDHSIADKGTIEAGHFKGEVSMKDVWFAYNDEEYVLKGIDLEVKEGQTIAFVGATGAGKSSLINLLSRLYEFQKGEIRIDGRDIRDYKLMSLRKNIAVVLQDVFLFSDTIHNNISLRDPKISREEIIEASRRVGAHDFIMNLPGNYDYNVRERGSTLSVGQRQLISFIRAYVTNPSILILDEATSSVDTDSELLIQNAIEKLTEGRTSIVIAHRLSTIQQADLIVVMDHGKIIEVGSHQDLLAKNGQYKHLFELQFS
ncbi:MAG TPA: ABC transporter ATP-binding protein [Flavobacteriales bacterium]|nr:antibiotic ABC transporter ATP-binding protein [Flavobacteriales bacterium]HRE97390.1 ABC transporter ATP-binding protein [Flavobacteriales bacterium]HRJ35936.1 ABC transporter ATP-binding protein [Flavobacteriales bacterium]HRJ38942.1 ABC transporter ATP-binding protein [Flavobacteriales bacterium]